MTAWKGWGAKAYTPAAFITYVESLLFLNWRPSLIVVHNTQIPTFADWHSVPGPERLRNLVSYYENEKGWSGGPHVFVADDVIWTGTPLTVPGVHSPSWNGVSWGVETVGDYNKEPMNPAVFQNLASAVATLCDVIGLQPMSAIRFHKEDPLTTHKHCPGVNLNKSSLISLVQQKLIARHPGEHLPDRLAS